MPNIDPPIYLDYAAAAPLWPSVIEVVTKALGVPGNPGSQHEQGYALKQLWKQSLGAIAKQLGCTADELILTSGATESTNHAILGSVSRNTPLNTIHCISSTAEHAAGYGPLQALEQQGASISWLPVNDHGQINTTTLAEAIRPATHLISLIAAHNETGAIQPIREIVAVIRAAEQRVGHRILIHLDAAQWAAWHAINTHQIDVDLLTISGSKLGGPRCGLLYVRRGTPLRPIMYGGGQQHSYRPGTEDVVSATGLATALQITTDLLPKNSVMIRKLRDQIGTALQEAFPQVIRRDLPDGLPNILHLTLPGLDGEQAVYALSETGIAMATGSACSSTTSTDGQRVRKALGIPVQDLNATLRISLGLATTKEEIARTIPLLIDILNRTMDQANITQALQQRGSRLSQDYAGRDHE